MVATRHNEDLCLSRLSQICLALPEAARKDSGSHTAFLIRDRTFAYFLNNHHGDGIVLYICKALPGDNAIPDSACIGPKCWIALRLDRVDIGWDAIAELVLVGYCQLAPKRLIALIAGR